MKVVIIGASDKPNRYAYQALMLLKEKGHEVIPVHQRVRQINGMTVYPSISDVEGPVDTVTMYVGPQVSDKISGEILDKKPGRIIFNPGAENSALEKQAAARRIVTVNACTLVMLTTGRF